MSTLLKALLPLTYIGRGQAFRPLFRLNRGLSKMGAAPPGPDKVQSQTLGWIEEYVIGLNLCPFAKASLVSGDLQVIVCQDKTAQAVREMVNDAAEALAKKTKTGDRGTVVIAAPYVQELSEFGAHLGLAAEIEDDFCWSGFDGEIQLATFHPCYQFEGTDEEDVTNWTNRSPWPLFHLLREEEVSAAVDAYDGETDQIWQTNEETMRSLGKDKLGALIYGDPKNTNLG